MPFEPLDFLISRLAPQLRIPRVREEKWNTFRALVNLREPQPLDEEFLRVQDAFLQAETAAKGLTGIEDLEPVRDRLYLWQGDITTLRVDGIVNAANSGLLGCFQPCHACIDNVIHTYAGVQLRDACAEIMREQGHPEPIGQAKLTPGFNLPTRHVIHTVGPMISGPLTQRDREQLADCYRSCLALAEAHGLQTLAFCCISTGVFRFPPREAAAIAIKTVKDHLAQGPSCMRAIVFNVFKDEDLDIYRSMLGKLP